MARTLGLLGDRWSLLVVREALDGVRHYDRFRERLGISDHTLSRKLAGLVEHGLLDRVAAAGGPRRVEYRLTPAGEDLAGVLAALGLWGRRWRPGAGPDRPPPPAVAREISALAATARPGPPA